MSCQGENCDERKMSKSGCKGCPAYRGSLATVDEGYVRYVNFLIRKHREYKVSGIPARLKGHESRYLVAILDEIETINREQIER